MTTSESGQATVETVALLPVLLAVGLAAASVLAGHGAREQAGLAAQAGAMALLHGGDAREAARRALPAAVRDRAAVEVRGRRITVRVRPALPVPAASAAMTAEVSADAGPELSTDAGPESTDAGPESTDAGPEPSTDAGPEASTDAGPEASTDAGPEPGP